MYNQKYRKLSRIIKEGPVTGKTGFPVSSLLYFQAEFPSGAWRLSESTYLPLKVLFFPKSGATLKKALIKVTFLHSKDTTIYNKERGVQ